MTRWQAAGRHLLLSVFVASLATALVASVWYPPPLLFSARGHEMLAILLAVDVVLGPLLTLAVYKAGKKGMRFDLIVIGCLQVAGLVYGMSVVAQARPAFIVHAADQFELVAPGDIAEAAYAAAAPGFTRAPWSGPRWVYAELPRGQEAADLVLSVVAGGPDVHRLPKYFRPLQDHAAKVLPQSRSIEQLVRFNAGNQALVASEIARTGRAAGELRYIPLHSRRGDLAVLIDARTGAVVRIATLNPW
jgi:hypothetical protein